MKHGALLCMSSPVSLLPNFPHVLQFFSSFLPATEILKSLNRNPPIHWDPRDLAARSVYLVTVFSFSAPRNLIIPDNVARELPKPLFIFLLCIQGGHKVGGLFIMFLCCKLDPHCFFLYNHVSFIFTMSRLSVAPCFNLVFFFFCTGLFFFHSFLEIMKTTSSLLLKK